MLAISLLSIKDDINKIKIMDEMRPNYIHLDIMDGKFVSNIVEMLNYPEFNSPLDVHLMVNDIEEYIKKYSKLNPTYITFHLEATNDVNKIISLLKSQNIKVGISIKPETEVKKLLPYLDKIDLVLVMSVEPGYGGQAFLENSILKIKELDYLRKENHYNYLIEIDGGITSDIATKCEECDIFVVGSHITLSEDYEKKSDFFKFIN